MSEQTTQPVGRQTGTVEMTRGGVTYQPLVDILETDTELVVYGDLPGVDAEDLDIRFENRELVIHGRVPRRGPKEKFLYSEYGTGNFYRVFRIGEEIDVAKISAELNNGQLVLHLPKTDALRPRRVPVQVR
jgi:HSP20 family molecular chaperone IbpA